MTTIPIYRPGRRSWLPCCFSALPAGGGVGYADRLSEEAIRGSTACSSERHFDLVDAGS